MPINWKEVSDLRTKWAAEREFDRKYGPRQYRMVELDPVDYHQCPVCHGTGKTEEVGDLHRSAGIIPCPHYHCHGGIVRSKTVEIPRRVRVKAGSSRDR